MKALCAFHNFLLLNLREYKIVHIGQLIQKELYRQERSVTWFAEQLCCSRTNIYKIFLHSDINTMLLLKISVILHCNFFQYYSDTLGDIEKM